MLVGQRFIGWFCSGTGLRRCRVGALTGRAEGDCLASVSTIFLLPFEVTSILV